MSITQYQSQVNSLDKEIASLEKKKSDNDKECANLQKRISDTQKSITKNTSATTAASKLKQISGWQNDAAKKYADSADLGKKIADKRQKRNDNYLKLQKAQQDEQKKQNTEALKIQKSYERRILELQQQTQQYVIPVVHEGQTPVDSQEEYDVFVSHAYEDKEDFVDEFVAALRTEGFTVWYDSSQLKWGDKMRERIDEGLSKSKFGIVVLSPNYIKEGKYWTKAELSGLFQKESVTGKTILPIWHNLTKKQVIEYSPIIADIKAMTTADMTAEEIAAELKTLFEQDKTEGNDNGQA